MVGRPGHQDPSPVVEQDLARTGVMPVQATCQPERASESLRGVVDAWGEDKRATGQIRGWITASLAELGIARGDLPTDISF